MNIGRHRIVVLLAVIVVLDVLMILSGMGPDLLLVSALLAAIGVCGLALASAADSVPEPSPAVAPPRSTPPPRNERRVNQVRTSLAYGRTDGLSRERVHAGLVAVVDDQLRAVHEIDRALDPAAARAVLGPELTAFVEADEPPAALARPNDLDRILTRIERL